MEYSERFGRIIKEARLKNDMSIQNVAELSGVTRGYISRLEKGKCNPSRKVVVDVAKALDLPPKWLLTVAGYSTDYVASNEEDEAKYIPVGLRSQGNIDIEELEKAIERAAKRAIEGALKKKGGKEKR